MSHENLYEYHPPDRSKVATYSVVRIEFHNLHELLKEKLPEGRLKAQALDRLFETYLLSDAAIKNGILPTQSLPQETFDPTIQE